VRRREQVSRLDNILTLVCVTCWIACHSDTYTRVCILLFKSWLYISLFCLSSPSGHTEVRQLDVLHLRSFNGKIAGLSGEEYFAVYIFPSVRVYLVSISFAALFLLSFFLPFFSRMKRYCKAGRQVERGQDKPGQTCLGWRVWIESYPSPTSSSSLYRVFSLIYFTSAVDQDSWWGKGHKWWRVCVSLPSFIPS